MKTNVSKIVKFSASNAKIPKHFSKFPQNPGKRLLPFPTLSSSTNLRPTTPLPLSGNERAFQIQQSGGVKRINLLEGELLYGPSRQKSLLSPFSGTESLHQTRPLGCSPRCPPSQVRTQSGRHLQLGLADHSPPPSPHCQCSVQNWGSKQWP